MWLIRTFTGPYYFVTCSLLHNDQTYASAHESLVKSGLSGTLVSSIHRLKDNNNKDGGYFIFGDVSVKLEGTYRLQFTLFEIQDGNAEHLSSIVSDAFVAHPAKNFPGMSESTFLTRTFSEQGVRLRLRKEPRYRLGNRGPASDDYQPRQYNSQKRRQSQIGTESPVEQGTNYSISQTQAPPGYGEQLRSQANDYSAFGVSATQLQTPTTSGGYYDPPLQRTSLSSQSESFGSLGDETPSKRLKTEADATQSSLWGQNYSLQGSQYGQRPGSFSQPGPTYGGVGQGMTAVYGRDSGNPYGPRRNENQYSPYDLSGARPIQTPTTPGYFSSQHQSQFPSMAQSQNFGQSFSQGMAPDFPLSSRLNSFDTPIYGQSASYMPRGSFSGMSSLQPSSSYRAPSFSQTGLTFGGPNAQLPAPGSGQDFTSYPTGWPSRDNQPT